MDIKLKQRILGVIVLVALVGIILTVLLHNNKQPTADTSSQVASVPAMTTDNGNTAPAPTTDPNLNNVNSALNTVADQNQAQIQEQAQAQQAQAQAAATAAAQTAAQAQATEAAAAQVTSSVDASATSATTSTSTPDTTATTNAIDTTPPAAAAVPDATPVPAATPAAASTDVSIPTINPTVPSATVPVATTDTATSSTVAATPEKELMKVKHHHHEAAAAKETESKATAISTTSSENNSEGKNWTVQAGSFSEANHATELVKKLHEHGFEATAEKIHTAKGEMTRVIVGHADQTDASARELTAKLEKTMGIKAAIVPKQTKDLSAAQQ